MTVAEAGSREFLRQATRAAHDAVDEAFGAYAMAGRDGYTRFLRAQASVLPAMEHDLDPSALLPPWRGRGPLLEADLAALGEAMPPPAPLALPPGEAARLGAIYVLEGSRLGGAMLARQVPAEWPGAFLRTPAPPGLWRAVIALLEAEDAGPAWREAAAAGALAAFAAFLKAARTP
ncbi:biliverdin-producing heme oxygenase [Sabulicella glaciei]|uniref:Biliverdin-producing heme oxygenase n=1 Tax=Sabulicella glaciei TaxID=2984948 RepID=A0ABT3P035_9PROT|nr:biliverdin-producing heme oxygenase [Roseococcus sp. MDT2-1-1]MCW8087771.1 biliverdin-producing heme oxygenase [Roseococcus sp. MDT2-1-1]